MSIKCTHHLLTECFSMRNLDGSSTLDYIGYCMDHYTCCIRQHTVLVRFSFSQNNSLPNILNSDKDHYRARM